MKPTASLAVLIYNFAGMPFQNQIELAWARLWRMEMCRLYE